MDGMQERIYDALSDLQIAVDEGKFGIDNRFDRDAFEAEFDDEVKILLYVYEDELETED